MAKPDWGELQKRFLSDHAATGISPKEWCEAHNLNYVTARRYIKKTAAQNTKIYPRKIVRTAQKDKSADELVDIKLSAKVKRFIAEYLKDNNATAAAARAGYSDPNYGRQLIANPNVAQSIAQQQKASIARTLGSADEVLAQMWQLATFDANQLSQYRRGACRYCWGFGHHYQWRDAVEFEEKRLEALERDRREPEDSGGYGYDHNREPNPECPTISFQLNVTPLKLITLSSAFSMALTSSFLSASEVCVSDAQVIFPGVINLSPRIAKYFSVPGLAAWVVTNTRSP